jgi:hypothetical protein
MTRLSPGTYVSHPDRPDWGIGQVQSAIGMRVTVNFEHVGKLLIDAEHVALVRVDPQAELAAKSL